MANKLSATILLLLTFSTAFSCSKSESGNSTDTLARNSIAAEEIVSSHGCLDVPTYIEAVRSIDSRSPAQQISKNFQISSSVSIRKNFELLMAYGTFLFEKKSLQDSPDFPVYSQEGCHELSYRDSSGEKKVYKITKFARDFLRAENKAGEQVFYRWLSPKSMEVEIRYIVHDLPCRNETPIFVKTTKSVSWNESSPEQLEIDPRYLALVAETVGYDVQSLYDAEGTLLPDSIRDMIQKEPREDLFSCGTSSQPPPEETDEPDRDEHNGELDDSDNSNP